MRESKFVRASLLTILMSILSGAASSALAQNRLRVVTWNIGGGPCHARVADMKPFADEIRAKSPDVVALQEVHFDQAHWLAYHLWQTTNFHVQFVWTQRCASSPSLIDYGNAIISRLPMKQEGWPLDAGFEVAPDPKRKANGNPEYIRVAKGSVQLRTSDGRSPNGPWVRVYSAHLTGDNGTPELASKQSAQTLTHILINDAAAAGQPRAVLMGDFNTRPSVEPCPAFTPGFTQYGLLTHWWGTPQFTDAWTVKPDPSDICGFTISARNVPEPGTRYDYIFLRNAGKFKVNRMERIKTRRRLSNHFPVYAELFF